MSSTDTSKQESADPLPKGARAPTLVLSGPNDTGRVAPLLSPPADSRQALLDPDQHVQFATLPRGNASRMTSGISEKGTSLEEYDELPIGWEPPPLRWWYAVSLISVLVALAVVLEVLLFFTKKRNGWKTHGDTTSVTGVMHYVYTLPPVIIAAALSALWVWTDIEIKKMQPYVDLVRGDAPAQKSLLLDYTRTNNFVVWSAAFRNRHWVVAAATIMVLVTLTFQPLAGALLTTKNTWITVPTVTRNTIATVGLNQNSSFSDLTVFLTAAGYASATANAGYDLTRPPFVFQSYTVTPFNIPVDLVQNGTITANATAIRSDTNCVSVPVTMTNHTDGSGWTNDLSYNGCTLEWNVDKSTTNLFGTNTANCTDTTIPPQFLPVVFWFFTYQPTAQSSATFCTPTISLHDATITVDLATQLVTGVHELGPFTASSAFGSLSGNLTGAPLDGRAYNGINFTLNSPDKFILARESAIQLTMPAAIFQTAVESSQGLEGSFTSDSFVTWSNQVYETYLTLIAKAVYFLPNQEPISIQIKTFELRLWMTEFAVHLLAALLFLLAITAAWIHLYHRHLRAHLNLLHQPGTIASAVSIGADTGMGQLLARQRNFDEIQAALQDHKFRIDPYSMKIVMDNEEEYHALGGPDQRRFSMFDAMQSRRASRRFSRIPPGSPGIPKSPKTPRTPQSANSNGAAASGVDA